jgi:hypothetical protein
MPLGILIDKELQEVNQVFVPIFNSDDSFLIDYVQKLIYNNNSKVMVLDVNEHINSNFVIKSAINSLEEKYPQNITLMKERIIKKEFLSNQDLMIISLESWKTLVETRSIWLSRVPSVLILKQ